MSLIHTKHRMENSQHIHIQTATSETTLHRLIAAPMHDAKQVYNKTKQN